MGGKGEGGQIGRVSYGKYKELCYFEKVLLGSTSASKDEKLISIVMMDGCFYNDSTIDNVVLYHS